MSLFGSLMGDVEDDPFFGSHMRHMRQMNNMMNSLFSDPFGMLGGPMSLMPRPGSMGMMPFMPQMPQMNRLFSDLEGHMGAPGSSFSSSTIVMSSSGPNGKPQVRHQSSRHVYSSSSSTKIGPDGIKETRKTLEDSRSGTKKMSIGHHIGDRAHVVERAQNLYSGDREETQEFINLDEEEAEDFDREFQAKAGAFVGGGARAAIAPRARLAIEPPPAHAHAHDAGPSRAPLAARPAPRRPLRASAGPLTGTNRASVREVYGGPHPQRHRHRHHKRPAPADN